MENIMNIKSTTTMAQLAKIYGVSVKSFKQQIEAHKHIQQGLKYSYFTGNLFYPKHQEIVFKHLSDPRQNQSSQTNKTEGHELK